ncbi:MAG: PTS sugar transporter subunit IIB [Erysipelotrichaceae bacterium]|nr:PTS sugar transporter subunit IIB [Erysipelotrichaceae bacterium]
MVKVMLVCAEGMSVTLLMDIMQREADSQNIDCCIYVVNPQDVRAGYIEYNVDVILLGPQVAYMQKQLEKDVDHKIPVGVINVKDYGLMDGKHVLAEALKLVHND